MSLLDGKYEIISERALGARTVFEATAADGTAVQITWFELTTGEQEATFESYRRVLRSLRQGGVAAIYDLVSRPGAHYVAWRCPSDFGHSTPASTGAIEAALQRHGRCIEQASVHNDGEGKALVYGLTLDGTPQTQPVPSQVTPPWKTLRPPAPPLWLLGWLPGGVMALVGVLCLYGGFVLRNRDDLVIIPSLNGHGLEEASSHLYGLGLSVTIEEVRSEEEAGRIVGVTPPEGSQLRRGREVVLRYAVPADQLAAVRAPDLLGRQVESAGPEGVRRVLNGADLELGRVVRVPADAQSGTVLAQSPSAGTALPRNNRVDVLVSEGPAREETFLPDLTGMRAEDAEWLAQLAGLEQPISVQTVAHAREAVGTVIAQNLAPGVRVPRSGTTLVLTVVGQTQTADALTPNLIGLSEDEIDTVAPGVRIAAVRYLSRTDLPQGVVMQEPSSGTPPAEDGAMRLTVNLHPVAVPRPQPRVSLQEPRMRAATFGWYIEPGIPAQRAVVTATTLDGERTLVRAVRVQGGERVEGDWQTRKLGPVTFTLTLNGDPYSVPIRTTPR